MQLLLEEMSSVEGKDAGKLTMPQFVYLVRTEPVLRQWVPLEDDAGPAAYEHRAAVVRRAMARASTAGHDSPTFAVAAAAASAKAEAAASEANGASAAAVPS